MKRMLICAATIASSVLGVAAASRAEEGTMVVKVDGLDLHSASGAAMALTRIKMAAYHFCGNHDPDPLDLQSESAIPKCRNDMTHRAVDKLNEPMVTALYQRAQPTMVLAQR